ncbi:MAG TPA: PLP-dependent aspartate aminotransferase family protein [Thermomicrobiales bacterium]|nr:PLP-dependent aspartate aminotransferase family protein [Thermomicrobiales bacterium]
MQDFGLSTRCVHAGEAPDPSTGAHGVPLYANVTYAFRTYEQLEAMRAGAAPHFTYAPRGNPTVRSLELKLADLEGAERSVAGDCGMAVIAATLLTLCANGGHVIAPCDMYELARSFLQRELADAGGAATLVDIADLAAVERAITPDTRVIYAEPFSNPLMQVADVPALAELAHAHGATLVVDNTFLSPALLRPIALGADLVLHSATKYISGHGQVQGGIVSGRRAVVEPIQDRLIRMGGAMAPFAAWTLLAGVKTLALRIDRHGRNAGAIARLLASHPAVDTVNYPGLPGHPGHAIAAAMLGSDANFGGMLSFTLRGGEPARAAFVNALKLAAIAVSLGDCGTLVWPWAASPLLRLSVGIEDEADLLADFAQALTAATAAPA